MHQSDRPPLLEFEQVSRTFPSANGTLTAVDHVTFSVRAGQLLALLGPNGAGKTTCVKMASTLLLQSAGTIRIDGIDTATHPGQARRRLGLVLGGDRGFYLRASALENLRFFAELQGVSGRAQTDAVTTALEQVGLADRAKDRVEVFSRGMRQRLHIARAITSAPSVLLLDEPSIGLDPESARDLRRLVSGLRNNGTAVVLTTHYMREAEELADDIAVIDSGRIIARGEASDIAEAAGIGQVTSFRATHTQDEALERVRSLPQAANAAFEHRNGILTADVVWSGAPQHDLLHDVFGSAILAGTLFDRPATLEEAYLALVSRSDRG